MPADLARYQAVFPERAQRALRNIALAAERLETSYAFFHRWNANWPILSRCRRSKCQSKFELRSAVVRR